MQTSLSVEHELCPERADCIRMEVCTYMCGDDEGVV